MPKKSWVIGVIANGKAIAFPVESLAKHGKATHRLGETTVTLNYDPASRLARATTADGTELPAVTVFWFAWQAVHPQTEIWKP